MLSKKGALRLVDLSTVLEELLSLTEQPTDSAQNWTESAYTIYIVLGRQLYK